LKIIYKLMKNYFLLLLKGIAMGIANVIPGVSGGTIALITGIYEELINSLKSFDNKALKYLFTFKIKKFLNHTNFYFILIVFSGSIGILFIIAYPLEFLLNEHTKFVYSLFFGLIIASVFSVGRLIKKWNLSSTIAVIFGFTIAIIITYLIPPANENENLLYIFICGIVSISGMMLPGLSGSYILILLGNYQLIFAKTFTKFINSIQTIFDNNINFDPNPTIILSCFCAGSLFGLLSFSHLLAWLLKKYKDQTLAILTGFIIGSLSVIWPWKKVKDYIIIEGNKKVSGYDLFFPNEISLDNLIAVVLIILGFLIVFIIEKISLSKK
tara:strand:+ start:251 stop:1228 length:978 start_codon:yes stop_codon:yes gene_type:complete